MEACASFCPSIICLLGILKFETFDQRPPPPYQRLAGLAYVVTYLLSFPEGHLEKFLEMLLQLDPIVWMTPWNDYQWRDPNSFSIA
jgi:hypothetical protein